MIGICGFFGNYRFLSNFYPAEIEYEGLKYHSVEAAYQSAKTLDMNIRLKFTEMNASNAKLSGRKVNLRKDWEQVKVDVMRELLIKKFQDPQLRIKLLLTKNEYLEETNTWNDTFWGVCNGKGKNILGKLLMEIRERTRL